MLTLLSNEAKEKKVAVAISIVNIKKLSVKKKIT